MKFLLAAVLALSALFTNHQALAAGHGPFGLGIVLAGPTGLSASYEYAGDKSIAGALAWGNGSFYLSADHLWVQPDLVKVDGIGIDVYFGLGGRLENRDREDNKSEQTLGMRLPVGLSYHFQKVPLQLFGELAPALILVDSSEFVVDVAVGGRYFF